MFDYLNSRPSEEWRDLDDSNLRLCATGSLVAHEITKRALAGVLDAKYRKTDCKYSHVRWSEQTIRISYSA